VTGNKCRTGADNLFLGISPFTQTMFVQQLPLLLLLPLNQGCIGDVSGEV
jgi:hypothetical protein